MMETRQGLAMDRVFRQHLARLCEDRNRRINGRNLNVPNRWWPERVTHPDLRMKFSDAGAWDFIADCLRDMDGVQVKTIDQLERPPIPGHYMLVTVGSGSRRIYIKIAYFDRSDTVLGVSFHYEDPR